MQVRGFCHCWNAGGICTMTCDTNEIPLVKFPNQQPVYSLVLPKYWCAVVRPYKHASCSAEEDLAETALDSGWLCYPVTKEGIVFKVLAKYTARCLLLLVAVKLRAFNGGPKERRWVVLSIVRTFCSYGIKRRSNTKFINYDTGRQNVCSIHKLSFMSRKIPWVLG